MPISLDVLDRAAIRPVPYMVAKSLQEARIKARRTAFLSHSHHDRARAKGLQTLLAEHGWDIFIDWEHQTLDERPTKETVIWLPRAIKERDWLIYLATPNAEKSRWCPWEIGFADGEKSASAILIVATSDGKGTYGGEYLHLYRQISETRAGGLAVFEPGQTSSGRYLRDVPTAPSGY